MLWDMHMHTHFSGDSDADPEAMVRCAIQKGLPGICFTDHFDYDYPDEPDLFLLDFNRYRDTVCTLKEKYKSRIEILWGVELGLQPHIADINKKTAEDYPFDFIIGSSHVVHQTDPYYPKFYEGRSEADAYLEYFESILENLHTEAAFDVYGHIDYVVRYGPNKNRFYSYEKYADVIDEILRTLIHMGKGIELNTAGFRYGIGHPNPAEPVLARYRELGGELITVGSDAHVPEHIASDFAAAEHLLRAAGFSGHTVFRGRKPCFQPLDSR